MLIPLHSQIIDAISYDSAQQSLFVQLCSGKAYIYDNIPRALAQGLVDSDSPGRYFNAQIKAHHTARRVEGAFG